MDLGLSQRLAMPGSDRERPERDAGGLRRGDGVREGGWG